MDSGSARVNDILQQFDRIHLKGANSSPAGGGTSPSPAGGGLNASTIVRTAPALMFDSVYTLAAGLMDLERSGGQPAAMWQPGNVSCDLEDSPWPAGRRVYGHLAGARLHGLTGPIEFDGAGRRHHFKLDLLKLKREHVQKVRSINRCFG